MNLSSLLAQRIAKRGPVRIGIIGAGKFGSMILAQAQRIEGLHVVAAADLDVVRARAFFQRVFWPQERYGAKSLAEALKTGATCILDDASALLSFPDIDA